MARTASIKIGDRFTDGIREYVVRRVADQVVEYWDCYKDEGLGRGAFLRTSSLLQWEADVARGALKRREEAR